MMIFYTTAQRARHDGDKLSTDDDHHEDPCPFSFCRAALMNPGGPVLPGPWQPARRMRRPSYVAYALDGSDLPCRMDQDRSRRPFHRHAEAVHHRTAHLDDDQSMAHPK